jgi:hypothetical protein
MGLSFTIVAGPCQCSHSQLRVPQGSRPYFTVSDLRLLQPAGRGLHSYILQEQGGPVIPPGTGFPFHCLVQLAGLQWRYSNMPPHRVTLSNNRTTSHHYIALAWSIQKTSLLLLRISHCQGNVSTELFPSNGCCTVASLHSCYLAIGLHVTIC